MIIKVKDNLNLVPTSDYPYAEFSFPDFNCIQSRVFEFYNQDCNCVISASTSAGKTVIAEMLLAYEIRERKNKGIYLCPIKALAQEKLDDWKVNHFKDINVSICTGDYKLTPSRNKELDEADLVVMTSEMLASRVRNYRSEQSNFLKAVKTVVADEAHILDEDRGTNFECAIMKFTELNKDSRIVFLSATMSNAGEIGEWLSKLNGKPTYVLESTYRPCPLHIHYIPYQDKWKYDDNEKEKITTTMDIFHKYPQDKFIFFVHGKKTGEALMGVLNMYGIESAYHTADQPKSKRLTIEKRFREDPKLRVVVATSTLSQGLNMPARRVVIVGIHRGIQEVKSQQINQGAGRAGRPQYDPRGDAYILLPRKSFETYKAKLQEPFIVRSQMLDEKTLAFHIISEIHHRNIQSLVDVYDWYERSLAHHQNVQLDDDIIEEVIKNLTRCGAITEEQGCYDVTSIGIISSMFYYSPFDISDLNRNFSKLFENDKESDDCWLAMALANINSHKQNIVSSSEREEIIKFKKKLDDTNCESVFCGPRDFAEGSLKIGCCYYNLLKGHNSLTLNAAMNAIRMDSERLCEVLGVLNKMTGKWEQPDFFKRFYLRLLYGIEEKMVDLCCLKGIGKIKAKRLWDANLRDLHSISENIIGVMKALNCSKNVATQICENAKEIK